MATTSFTAQRKGQAEPIPEHPADNRGPKMPVWILSPGPAFSSAKKPLNKQHWPKKKRHQVKLSTAVLGAENSEDAPPRLASFAPYNLRAAPALCKAHCGHKHKSVRRAPLLMRI